MPSLQEWELSVNHAYAGQNYMQLQALDYIFRFVALNSHFILYRVG